MNVNLLKKVAEKDLGEKVIKISKCVYGLHNYNFVIRTKTRKIIAKISASDSDIKNKILKKQYVFLKSHQNKINIPKTIKYSENNELKKPILYTEFIEGKHFDLNKLSNEKIKNLAIEIAKINSNTNNKFSINLGRKPTLKGDFLKYAQVISKNTTYDEYKKYKHNTSKKEHQIIIENGMNILKKILSETKLFNQTKFSLLHTDIGKHNIIWKKDTPYFIDWDEKIYGDPADSTGYIFAINNSPNNFRKLFLKEYIKHIKDSSFIKRVHIYELKNRLCDVAWSLSKLDKNSDTLKSKSDRMYRKFYSDRYKNLVKFLESNF